MASQGVAQDGEAMVRSRGEMSMATSITTYDDASKQSRQIDRQAYKHKYEAGNRGCRVSR